MFAALAADQFLAHGFLFCVALIYGAALAYRVSSPGGRSPAALGGKVQTDHLDHWDLLGILFVFLIYGAGLLADVMGDDAKPAEPRRLTAATIWFSTIIQLSMVVVPLALIGRKAGLVSPLGLRGYGKPYLIPAMAFAGYFAALVLVAALEILGINGWISEQFGKFQPQEAVALLQESQDSALIIAMAFAAVVVAPIVEEIFFRGYLYPVTKRFSDRYFAAFVTSLLFALMHGNVHVLPALFILAVIMCVLFELTGSLWAPIALHVIFNGATTLALTLGDVELPAFIPVFYNLL